jgi:nicotinamide phosphoribosyltransferase
MNNNLLLMTDAYKFGHIEQYPEGMNKVYSYLISRSDHKYKEQMFFGLQYYLKRYLNPVTCEDIQEAVHYRKQILGSCPSSLVAAFLNLYKLGYLPLKIKAVPEGMVLPVKNVLMTITNTHPDFYWLVGYVESLLLKVWNTISVATYSYEMKKLITKFVEMTCDDTSPIPFMLHDFGYRGCSSEETAALSGAAHLCNFLGTDTVPAVKLLDQYYMADGTSGYSVPASEHSVMCAYGKENEIDAFRAMLKLYPTGILSIVADSYNVWKVLVNILPQLKDEIIARDGKVVIRPDSGDPHKIICGNHEGTNVFEKTGCLRLLDSTFGSTTNSKGFKVLNPKIGLIYGDGMYYERYKHILQDMHAMDYAASNLVIGVGGLLLQQHNRDDLGITFKATYGERHGKPFDIVKDPITDAKKKSHQGLLCLENKDGVISTKEHCSAEEEQSGLLRVVYEDGKLYNQSDLNDIRERANAK